MNEILKYSISKIIDDIRNQNKIHAELIDEISELNIIDEMRKLVKEQDIVVFLDYLQFNIDIKLKTLIIDLLQPFKNNDAVKKVLFSIWYESSDYLEKSYLCFRLLDYDDLSEDLHRSIYDFIENNWERFINDSNKWFAKNDINNLLAAMKLRLSDRRFPLTKSWIYLLISTASPDKNGCKNLFEEFKDKQIPNYNQIIQRIKIKEQ